MFRNFCKNFRTSTKILTRNLRIKAYVSTGFLVGCVGTKIYLDKTTKYNTCNLSNIIDYASPEKYITMIQENLIDEDYEIVSMLYFRFCIRSMQDVQCSEYSSPEASELFLLNFKQLLFRPIFSQHAEELYYQLTSNIYLEVAKEIKYETENDMLEDPSWVGKYGTLTFSDNKMKPSHLWKQIRLEYINQVIKLLELELKIKHKFDFDREQDFKCENKHKIEFECDAFLQHDILISNEIDDDINRQIRYRHSGVIDTK